MARLVVRYREEGAVRWGYVEGDPPAHATDAVEIRPIVTHAATTADLITALDAMPPAVTTGPSVRIMAKRLLSPVTTDATIIGQAFNYANSAEEAATARPSHMLFTRASSALTGPYDDIVRPLEVELLDYEAEIGIVLRRDLGEPTEIGAANVGDYVAAVVLCNDVSPRDAMFGATFLQWYQGKSYRTFCPAGPVLYLLDRGEVAAVLDNLEIRLWLNGELRQSAHSTQIILRPAQTLSFISRHIDMKRGDLLITGTPAGVVQVISPRVIEIMQTHLMDDERRRDELRKELGNGRRFMEPGDIVSLTLRDTRSGKDLGGHESRIAAVRS